MRLTDQESRYLARRRSLVRRWPIVGAILLVAIAVVLAFLFLRSPLLANPWQTASLLMAERVPPPIMAEMAVKLPVVFLVCCGLLVGLVLFQFGAAVTERRLLSLIDSLLEGDRAEQDDR
jgi:hypothetical protein